MSLLLSHLKSYDTKTSDNRRSVQNTRAASASGNIARSNGTEFVKGEVLKGQVVDLRNHQATIQLSDGSVVQGKIDQEVDLYIGQNATFEVVKSSESGIQLKIIPEQQQNPMDSLIQKALIQAGLPLSDKNRAAVGTLLDANLSVDKQSILQFLKVMHQYPQADVKELVFLQKHNLPINETNLSMLNEYQSSEHRIISQLHSLTNGIAEMFHSGVDEATGMKLLQFALEEPAYVENTRTGSENAGDSNLVQTSGQSAPQAIEQQAVSDMNQAANSETQAVLEHPTVEDQRSKAPHEMNLLNEQHPISEQPLQQHFTGPQLQQLSKQLEDSGFPKEIVKQLKDGSITGHELLKAVQEFAQKSTSEEGKDGILKECMKSEVLQKVYQEELFHKFTMSPKQLSNGENVKKFYEKLEQNLEDMNQLIQNNARGEEAQKLTGQTEHLKNNLDFMKTLNEIYPYIQLPVRLKDQNIHSELYVFTKKKGKLSDQEIVRLLLHLDMDHIGPLDIHLEMSKKNLKAHFFVESEAVQNLFETTIDELDMALREKGYRLYSEFHQQEKQSNPIDEMVLQEQVSEGMTMKRFTFDVRA